MSNRKMLLFGGTGFVGSRVAQKALSRGYRVVIATRGGAPPPGSPMDALYQRVREVGGPAAAREMLGLHGDRSIHASALASPSSTTSDTTVGSSGPSKGEEATSSTADDLVHAVHHMNTKAALEFVSIDASSRDQVFHFLHDHPDATSIVNAVGLLTRDYDEARQINGDVMTHIAAGVFHPKLSNAVKKVVYVSAEPYNLYSRRILGSKALLKGYFHGKRIGERAVLDNLGTKGVVLRPSFIYGTRHLLMPSAVYPGSVSTISLPLGWVGYPLDKLLTAVGGGKLLMPPVDVDVVAEAAVRACVWAGLPDHDVHGTCDVYRMRAISAMADPTV